MNDQTGPIISDLFKNGQIYGELEKYLTFCAQDPSDEEYKGSKKQASRESPFPNLAGFCRYVRSSILEFENAYIDYPTECARILTILEDEALNSDRSTNLISAYLKKRLGYDSSAKSAASDTQLQIRFEHDIFEDGE